MRRIDKAFQSIGSSHRQESYSGSLASTSGGGHVGNVNNLYNSQVRDAVMMMPYGISSRPYSGIKAQAVVNDNSNSSVVGVYDPNRPKVGVGEICIYSSGGCSIYLSRGGITMSAGGINVSIGPSKVDISGTIDVKDLNIDGKSIEDIIDEKINEAISKLD